MKKHTHPKKHRQIELIKEDESTWESIQAGIVFIMCIIAFMFLFAVMTSCTMSVNMMNSQGKAEDVVDTDQKADADVSPTLSIPALPAL